MSIRPPVSAEARRLADTMALLQRRIDDLEKGIRTGQLGNSSLENSGLNSYDAAGNLRYTVGLQQDGTYGQVNVNNPNPPPVPGTPVLTPEIATIRVKYQGDTRDGIGIPSDWSHANIYVAPPSGEYTLQGRIGQVGGEFIIGPLEYQLYSVRLTNVNFSGKESDPGTATQAQPTQVVSQDLIDGIVTETKLAANAVTAAAIAAGAVGSAKLQDGAVELGKLADGSVSASKIIDGAVEHGKIAADAVGANEIAANSIVAGKIATDAVEARHVIAGAIEAGKIAVDAVQAGNIVAGAITSEKIQALAITSDKIEANNILAGHIQAGAVTSEKLEAELIVAGDPDGDRVQLSQVNGIEAYFGGDQTLSIPPNGKALLRGTIETSLDGSRVMVSPGSPSDGIQTPSVAFWGDNASDPAMIYATPYGLGTSPTQVVVRSSVDSTDDDRVSTIFLSDDRYVAMNAVITPPTTGFPNGNTVPDGGVIWMEKDFAMIDLRTASVGTGSRQGGFFLAEDNLTFVGTGDSSGDSCFIQFQRNDGLIWIKSNDGGVLIQSAGGGTIQLYESGDINIYNVNNDNEGINGGRLWIPGPNYDGDKVPQLLKEDNDGDTGVIVYKPFIIDHPLDEDRWLIHACIEGPTADVFYRGEVEIQDGQAEVQLPAYFEALTQVEGRQVQATPVDELCMVATSRIENGKFTIKCSGPDGTVVQWTTFAIRADGEQFPVEPLKSEVSVAGQGPYRYLGVEQTVGGTSDSASKPIKVSSHDRAAAPRPGRRGPKASDQRDGDLADPHSVRLRATEPPPRPDTNR